MNATDEATALLTDEKVRELMNDTLRQAGDYATGVRVQLLRKAILTLMAPMLDKLDAARGVGTITGPVGPLPKA